MLSPLLVRRVSKCFLSFAVGTLPVLLATLTISRHALRADEPATSTTQSAAEQAKHALADYVSKPDKSYGYVKRREGKLGKGTYVELTLTSQTWHDIVWKHQLFIYKPSKLAAGKQGLLVIEGGNWKDSLEKPPVSNEDAQLPGSALAIAAAAEESQTLLAVVMQVPQQPIFDGKVEDQIISYTFLRFMLTQDNEWPLLLPMVKSAVRAMDAIQDYTQREWSVKIEHFTVTGASKRGWTTWLTAAVDPRVNALAPMVIDMLNMGPQMKLQIASFGKYSDQIRDYTALGLQQALDTPRGHALQCIVDPYSYRQQITQPKVIMLGTNDRYWPLEALNVYWDDLVGEKYILYVPNSGHGLRDYPRIVGTLAALNRRVSQGMPLPKLSWKFNEHEGLVNLQVQSDIHPREAHFWTATAKTRDFRDSKWEQRTGKLEAGAATFDLPLPETGYAALFGELVFSGDELPYYLSTNVHIYPSTTTAQAEKTEPPK